MGHGGALRWLGKVTLRAGFGSIPAQAGDGLIQTKPPKIILASGQRDRPLRSPVRGSPKSDRGFIGPDRLHRERERLRPG